MKHDYHGKPASLSARLMRVARRYKRKTDPKRRRSLRLCLREARRRREAAPAEVHSAPRCHLLCVDDKNVLWIGTNEGLWRIDESERMSSTACNASRANARMLDNSVKAVEPDGKNGVWVLTETGVSHIEMRLLSVEHKANLHSAMDERIVQRRGMLSGTDWSAERNRWVPHGVRQRRTLDCSCRHGRHLPLRRDEERPVYPRADRHARKVATRWTEAVLLLEYIPHGRAKSRRSSATTSRHKPRLKRLSQARQRGKIEHPRFRPCEALFTPSSARR